MEENLMLNLQPLTLAQFPQVRRDLCRTLPRTCDFSVGGILLWRDYLKVRYATVGGALIYQLQLPDGVTAFQAPADPNPALLHAIYEHCKETKAPCRLVFVPEERKEEILKEFPAATVTEQRDWFDYLHRKEDLISYAGKKLKGQRNHVNKFLATYPQWSFSQGTGDDLPELRKFYEKFRGENQKDAPAWKEEERKLQEVFDRFEEYGFLCGILRVNGKIVAFSLGETVGDTLIVHTEKADRSFQGVYPMLTARFAELFAKDGIAYVNREDDSGDDGLRQAKLSYHPHTLLAKYLIEIA